MAARSLRPPARSRCPRPPASPRMLRAWPSSGTGSPSMPGGGGGAAPGGGVPVGPGGGAPADSPPGGRAAKGGGRPRLLAVVPRLDGHQGLDTLLRMLTRVPGAELVIAGGPARSQLRKDEAYQHLTGLAERLGVADRVSVTRKISSGGLPALLRSAQLLVGCSPYAPSGATVL